jgi:hypothetical protein
MFDFNAFQKLNDTFVEETREEFKRIYAEEDLNEKYQIRKDDAIKFVEQITELYLTDPSRVYFTFPFFDTNPMVFLSSLLSFYGNYFFDDSYFSIEFYDSRYNKKTGCVEYYPALPWADFSYPKVVGNDDGTQDPKKLLELLDWIENQKVKEKERHENLQKWINRGSK